MDRVFERTRGDPSQAATLRLAGIDTTQPVAQNTAIHSLPLRNAARSIAASTGQKGAIIVTLGKDGIHVAADGLNPEDVREALCTAIHASFLFDEER